MMRVAVLATLAVLIAGASASAAPAPLPGGTTYTWMPCLGTTGEVSGLNHFDGDHYAVIHSITPCVTPSPTNVYGIALYYADHTAWATPLVYPQPGVTVWAGLSHFDADTVALCLITAPSSRIACRGLVAGTDGVFTLGAVLPVTAPAVSVTATVFPFAMAAPDRPNCLSCPT
jgi:hypothetical protein